MVSFPEAIQLFFKNYTNFQGRSRRSEYWWVQLFLFLVLLVPYILMFSVGGLASGEPNAIGLILLGLVGLFALAIILPGIALGVRRFHDLGQTGWLVLVFAIAGVIPVVGLLASLGQFIWFCFPGTSGPNKYGPDPRMGEVAADTFA
ncbi:MAG: DUF805 domain-containing protein [Pseudomonadota bacterium]